jgi:hypothetical protein
MTAQVTDSRIDSLVDLTDYRGHHVETARATVCPGPICGTYELNITLQFDSTAIQMAALPGTAVGNIANVARALAGRMVARHCERIGVAHA